jgi:hypothetical protein
MSEGSKPSLETNAIPLRRPRLLGLLALTLWVTAVAVSGTDAVLAYDHTKVLIFTAGLVMMDLAAAIVTSLMWYVSRHYIQPLNENQAEIAYSYRAGFRDATVRFLRPGPDLFLVRPVGPPQHVSPQRSHFAAESQRRTGDNVT